MADRVSMRLGIVAKLGLIAIGVLSFGTVPLIISAVTKKHWVKALDRDGLTLRNGDRLKWADLTKVERKVVEAGLMTVAPIQLHFGPRIAQIVPRFYANRKEILTFLGEVIPSK